MVGPIVVLPPSGAGFSGPRQPAHKRPAKAFYRRYCPKTGTRYEFAHYVDRLEEVEVELSWQGQTYWLTGYEQDEGFVPYIDKKGK